jgi:hypothetical protein
MPSKRRSDQPAKPEELSRPALLAKYGITDTTLRRLTDRLKLVSLEAFSEHGKVKYVISKEDDVILKMSALCPWSIKTTRTPYHRHLFLKILTSSDQEVLDDFAGRGIENRNLTLKYVSGMRKLILSVAPPVIIKMISELRGPNTEAESSKFEILLSIVGIAGVYQDPVTLEDFYFHDPDLMHFINQVVWSHSAPNDAKVNLITHAVGTKVISTNGLALYQHMFHDKSFMTQADLAWYFSGLRPKIRQAYAESALLSTEEFMVRARLAQNTVTELQHLSKTLKNKVRDLSSSADPTARIEATRLITAIIKVDDHLGKLNPGSTNKEIPEYLREITPITYDYQDMFKEDKNGAENTG